MRSLFTLLFFTSVLSAQFENRAAELPQDTLAKIGTRIVSAQDFLERFELMPWPNKDKVSRIEFTKLQFLYSMVAEKMLALEASAQNIGDDSTSLNFQHNLERMLVRDELYKHEILPNISISDNERSEGMQRFPFQIEAQVLGILTRKEGEFLHKKIVQSKNKNAVYKRFNDSLFVVLDTLQVPFGFADKKIEDIIYSIDKDSVSKPVETEYYGLVMFRVLNKTSHAVNSRMSIPDRLHKVENIINQRKQDSLAVKTFAKITSPQRAEADLDIFFPLADSVLAILKTDSMAYQTKRMYKFSTAAIHILEQKFSAVLPKKFITIESGNMSLGEVLTGLSNNNVLFPSLNIEHIRIVLNNNIKTVIQNEMLTREGMKKNLQQSQSVRHDVATWMDSKKSWLLLRTIIDSVRISPDEIESEYQKHPQAYGATVMIRLREILVDSFALAKEIREKLKSGEGFAPLAEKYSKRKEWVARGGESPWIDISHYGELGIAATSVKIGEIIGPMKLQDGYSVFSVIERKIIDDSLRRNFGEVAKNIEQKLLSGKQQMTIDKYIGSLAKKYNVTINESILKKIKTTTTSMVTWRNIGFGGRIIAVPQMIPQTEWVYEWLKQQQVNQ